MGKVKKQGKGGAAAAASNGEESNTSAAAAPANDSFSRIKQLEDEVAASTSKVNNIVELLELSSIPTESDDLKVATAALQAVCRCFSRLMEKGSGLWARSGGASEQVRSWLLDRLREAVDRTLEFVAHERAGLQFVGMRCCLGLAARQVETGGSAASSSFGSGILTKLTTALLENPKLDNSVLEGLVSKYIVPYRDVRLFVMKAIALAVPKTKMQRKKMADANTFLVNAYSLLSLLPKPPAFGDEVEGEEMVPRSNNNNNKNENENENKKKRKKTKEGEDEEAETKGGKSASVKAHRKAYEDAWLSFFQCSLPRALYKKILTSLDTEILPFLNHPLLLADFLVASYNKGGVISILALNGLFMLIHNYNLEYPEFYTKLYALFEPSVLRCKYRAKFFRLANLFLKSSLLPAYIVAAFVKRLARMTLAVGPCGAMAALPLIFNLLRRHQSLSFLLHRGAKFVAELVAEDGTTGVDTSTEAIGEDPYDVDEVDPLKSNAMKSSLWEIEAIRKCWYPEVASLVAVFDTPVVRERPELDVMEPVKATSAALFEIEFARGPKKLKSTDGKTSFDIPLTYQRPATLLNDTPHFSAWRFE